MERARLGFNSVTFGVAASLVAGIAVAMGRKIGIDVDIMTACVLSVVSVIGLAIYGDTIRISKNLVLMLLLGLLIGIVYYQLVYANASVTVKSSNGVLGYVVYFINLAIVIPFFEEFMVRKLMFGGLSKHIGPVFAALAVSTVFAVTHNGSMVWAFVASISLCGLAHLEVDTVSRTVVHGSYNATLGALWLWGKIPF